MHACNCSGNGILVGSTLFPNVHTRMKLHPGGENCKIGAVVGGCVDFGQIYYFTSRPEATETENEVFIGQKDMAT